MVDMISGVRDDYVYTDNVLQESNDQSGSRGEANFVWRCKNCKVGPNCRSRLKGRLDHPSSNGQRSVRFLG
jgi:hypothetical protein